MKVYADLCRATVFGGGSVSRWLVSQRSLSGALVDIIRHYRYILRQSCMLHTMSSRNSPLLVFFPSLRLLSQSYIRTVARVGHRASPRSLFRTGSGALGTPGSQDTYIRTVRACLRVCLSHWGFGRSRAGFVTVRPGVREYRQTLFRLAFDLPRQGQHATALKGQWIFFAASRRERVVFVMRTYPRTGLTIEPAKASDFAVKSPESVDHSLYHWRCRKILETSPQ